MGEPRDPATRTAYQTGHRQPPRGTVTFLFTDIEGSSEVASMHPDAFPALLARHHAILREAFEAHGGFVFQIVGDAFCVTFDTAREALAASVDAQRRLLAEPWDPVLLRVRMGIHTGTAELVADERSGGYSGYPAMTRVQRVMSTAHGGQVLVSGASAEQARQQPPEGLTLRDLGQHRLKGLPESEHLWQVVAADLPQDFPRLQTLSTTPSNLPARLDSFVGRQGELREVEDRIRQWRLVTLVGPGGTGKTRLALQVAAGLLEEFDDRVYFVDLAPSRDVDAVVSAIAQVVGLRGTSTTSLFDDLVAHIGAQPTLLVLDNLEQVTVAGPAMVELLRDCPGLKQLTTSREPLHVSGEHVFPVPPVSHSEAVQLFVDRAQAAQPDFRITDENAGSVDELCRRLDGLPLAIELATARLRLFPPQALVERLGDRLQLLRGGARDAPARQQALRNTIDWSYELLTPGEQQLFRLFSVFHGATFEAVDDVTGRMRGAVDVDVLDGLTSLVDKSLVRQVDHGGLGYRLVMLETIREFAAARLDEDPQQSAEASRAHAAYFADWTERQWERLTDDRREAACAAMDADIENIRAAWRHWVAEPDFEELSKLTDSLWLLNHLRGWNHATVALTSDLLELLSSTSSTPERALEEITLQTSLARALQAIRGFTQEVEDAYRRALELCESVGEVPQLLPVLRGLASFYILRAEFEKAAAMGEQLLELAERYDDEVIRIEGHLVRGANLGFLNHLQDGLEHLEAAVAAYDPDRHGGGRFQTGNNPGVVGLTTSALFSWMLGLPDRSSERARQSIALSTRLGHPSSMAYASFHAGLIDLWNRAEALALERAEVVARLAEEHELPIWGAVGSCVRGRAQAGLGSAEEGLAVIKGAMATYQRLPTPPVFWPLLLHLQAGACGLAGRPAEGLALLDEAMSITEGSGFVLSPEFLRLKGQLLLARSPDGAEAEFRRAVVSASNAAAPMLQLRAALPLAALWRDQGRIEEARQLLRPAYDRFTEGFATADLRDARALLEELEATG
jgi:predicted ATPase/class 3 adenylate cyclase